MLKSAGRFSLLTLETERHPLCHRSDGYFCQFHVTRDVVNCEIAVVQEFLPVFLLCGFMG